MGGFQPNQEPEIRQEFEGKLFEPSFLEECTKLSKINAFQISVTYDPVKNRLSELQTEAKLIQSKGL